MIEIERDGAIAVLRLRAGKANAMNLRLFGALAKALDDAADADALVITGDGTAFSAGLALPELIDLDRTGMGELIDGLEDTMYRVLTWPRATVAAINGHAIAGGCVLALMCDVRLMVDGNAKIGLNEVQLGIGLPSIVVEVLRARVSPEAFATIALEGPLMLPHEALELALVDDVSANLEAKARTVAGVRAASPQAYAQIKTAQLAPVIAAWRARRPIERESWLDSWFSPAAQRMLRAAVDRLTKR